MLASSGTRMATGMWPPLVRTTSHTEGVGVGQCQKALTALVVGGCVEMHFVRGFLVGGGLSPIDWVGRFKAVRASELSITLREAQWSGVVCNWQDMMARAIERYIREHIGLLALRLPPNTAFD